MTPAALELARRLAEHPRWEWWEGVRESTGTRYLASGWACAWAAAKPRTPTGFPVAPVPDLDDWPTVGVLIGMLAEASRRERAPAGDVRLETHPPARWVAEAWPYTGPLPDAVRVVEADGPTPGEALAEALLEAWEPA